VLRLRQEENMKSALQDMADVKKARNQEKAQKRGDEQKVRLQKREEMAPILALFTDEGTWPPEHVEGSRVAKEPNLCLFKDFIKKHKIISIVPVIQGKVLSRPTLLSSFANSVFR